MVNQNPDDQACNGLECAKDRSVGRTDIFHSDLKSGDTDKAQRKRHENHDKPGICTEMKCEISRQSRCCKNHGGCHEMHIKNKFESIHAL